MPRKTTKKSAKLRAIKACHEYIRERDMKLQNGRCICCNGKISTAGHYIPAGSCEYLRFSEFNINGQCTSCNYYKSGNLVVYREKLIEKWGKEKVEDLELKKNMLIKRTLDDYLEIEKYYKQKLEDLKDETQ